MSGTMRVHSADAVRDYEAGETCCREPGYYLEAATESSGGRQARVKRAVRQSS